MAAERFGNRRDFGCFSPLVSLIIFHLSNEFVEASDSRADFASAIRCDVMHRLAPLIVFLVSNSAGLIVIEQFL
jgi:hypothetical protein